MMEVLRRKGRKTRLAVDAEIKLLRKERGDRVETKKAEGAEAESEARIERADRTRDKDKMSGQGGCTSQHLWESP